MLTRIAPNPITLVVDDLVYQHSLVKQLATQKDLLIRDRPDAQGGLLVLLETEVTLHAANPDGSLGDPLPTSVFLPRKVTLSADNKTGVTADGGLRFIQRSPFVAVDFATGQDVEIPVAGTLPQWSDWLAFLDSQPEQLFLQGEFFALLRDTQDLRIRTLIEHNMTQALAMGRYRL